jgi:immune inhibitor A
MQRKILFVMVAIVLAISAATGCGIAQTFVPPMPSPTNTPRPANTALWTNTPRTTPPPEPAFAQPTSGLWVDPLPPEAFETLYALSSTGYPARDLVDLALRLNHLGGPVPRVVRAEPWGFEIGDTHAFWVLNWETHEYSQITARLVYKTPHAYFFVEEGIDLDEARLKRLADRFDGRTYPTTRMFFGEEWSPGVDSDPHLTILFARNIGFSYQNSLDEYSRLVNGYSNEMEIFYLVADEGQLDDDCMLAHEFQHIIQWAVDPSEATWLNEGFSLLACPLNGMGISGYEIALDAFARQPDTQLNAWFGGDIDQAYAQYGTSYLFMAYFLDRFGKATLRALAAEQENGLAGVDAVLRSLNAGIEADDVFADWVLANYINDPSLLDGRYGYINLVPPSFDAEADYGVWDLPVERRTSVAQYAADYILLRGAGSFRVDFAGETLVRLAPTSAHSGKYVWWGGRGTNSDTTLTHEFDLTRLEQATLTFYAWYDIEKDYDYAYVEVSVDGKHWTTLPGQTTTNADPHGVNYGDGYTGTSQGWIQEVIDLTPYAGQKVQIRFEYLTDDGPVHAGLFLDDVEIPELHYREEAESSDAGWVAHGFIRHANVLPQEWMLQLVTNQADGTTVRRLQLKPDNTGDWTIHLGVDETAVLAISGRTRASAEPAGYWYRITTNSLP